ncbi:MAG TPA: hypothetical protein VKZ50_04130 [bacterium]|nr:hypothetical protein [bacterium]
MSGLDFPYRQCPLKHFVRTDGWLPMCRRRLQALRQGRRPKDVRRLRYFTFCAVSAIDVLMLDVARVIRPSKDGQFDTVFFFTRSDEAVLETRQSIPGATGFPDEFVETVLLDDLDEHITDILPEIPAERPDERHVRAEIRRLMIQRDFRRSFPFDVINLDLEGYLFKPSERIPGRLIRAIRKVFEWQQRPLVVGHRQEHLDGFGLMFTTKIGPERLGDDFGAMLRCTLEENIASDHSLRPILATRTGVDQVATLIGTDFEAFFKLAVPKIISKALIETDWYVDPTPGIIIYEFERRPTTQRADDYKMLHLVMDVRRQNPPRDSRAPGYTPSTTLTAYRQVVRQLFERPQTVVAMDTVDVAAMEKSLALIESRRKKYASES